MAGAAAAVTRAARSSLLACVVGLFAALPSVVDAVAASPGASSGGWLAGKIGKWRKLRDFAMEDVSSLRGRPSQRVALAALKKHDSTWMPMRELTADRAMLVLVRHGQSEWNFANRFIGWYDSPLTEEGQWEAQDAGRVLREHEIEVDEVHTSMLSRTLSTAKLALAKMRKGGLSVPKDSELRSTWRLNERSYGALTGRNKKECTKEYGKEQLKQWRRSWDFPPPKYEDGCELYEAETAAFRNKVASLTAEGIFDAAADPPPPELPRGESLKDTTERIRPYWETTLLPSLQQGKRVMVFGHENNLRALVKLMDGISEEDILSVDIPRAMPMVYFFEREKVLTGANDIPRLQPVKLTPEDAPEGSELMSARYLVDAALINAFHQRDLMNVYDTRVEENLEEVCYVDGEDMESAMCEVIGEYQNEFDDEDSDIHITASGEKELVGQTKVLSRTGAGSGSPTPAPAFAVARQGPRAMRQCCTPTVIETANLAMEANSLPCLGSGGSASGSAAAVLAAAIAATWLAARRRLSPARPGAIGQPRGRCASVVRMAASKEAEDDFYSAYDLGDEYGIAEEGGEEEDPECDVKTDLGCALEAGAIDAEEEICELLGYDLGETLIRQIGRRFQDDERLIAYRACGFESARAAETPQAIWLIGPSASGKSTLAPSVTEWVGMDVEGFVTVDGEPFRESHLGYQEALVQGKQKGCVWWGAYVGIRENVNKEKQRMLQEAVSLKKNLVIPSTCLRKSQCVDVAEMLLENGYLVHIVGVHGDKEEIITRGQRRAREKGKRYDPREFSLALRQFGPMLQLCNGRYRMVCTTSKRAPWEITGEGEGPLTAEQIQEVCSKVPGAEPAASAEAEAEAEAELSAA